MTASRAARTVSRSGTGVPDGLPGRVVRSIAERPVLSGRKSEPPFLSEPLITLLASPDQAIAEAAATGLSLNLPQRLHIGLWAQAYKSPQIIHPQAHSQIMLGHQLPRQTPGHANIAVVINHAAEDVPPGHTAPLQKMIAIVTSEQEKARQRRAKGSAGASAG